MRPYPYRGFTEEGKEVKGWYVKAFGHHYIYDDSDKENWEGKWGGEGTTHDLLTMLLGFVEVIPETVGQFTGLKDKNCKESYRDDKISFGSSRPTYLVKWSICNAGFYLESLDEQKERLVINTLTVGEVIGNIHSKPEEKK